MNDELKKRGGEVVAISTETPAKLKAGHARFPELQIRFASDEKAEALGKLHMQHDMFGQIVAAPGSILVDEKNIVRWVHYAQLVTDRPPPEVVIEQVKKLKDAQ